MNIGNTSQKYISVVDDKRYMFELKCQASFGL